MNQNSYMYYSMPPQKLPLSEKTDSWGKRCVDAIISMASNNMSNGRTSKQNKQRNYDLFNSKFEEEDFQYVLDPYGLGQSWGENPVKMQNYNIIRSKIELLKGEEIKRPFNFFAKGTGGEIISSKEQKKREMIIKMLNNQLLMELGEQVDESGEVLTPAQVQKYMDTQHVDPREVTANQLLNYLVKKEEVEMKFNEGFENALIAAEEIYHVGIVSGEPHLRVVNPLDFDFEKDSGLKFIEDAQWCKEERWLTPGLVLDLYGDQLSDKDIERIDRGELGYGMKGYGMQPGFMYEGSVADMRSIAAGSRPTNGIYVANVCWKSMKKIGFLSYIDPKTLEVVEVVVEDSYKMSADIKAAGGIITWQWINEVWEGTLIGNDIYVNVRPLPNQTRSMSNPSECKMPYTGMIYSNNNSEAASLIDLCKPHQYTYMIVWWRLEGELAKAKGKKFVFDISQLPKSQGWTMDQWLYYFDNLGIAVINSLEEGKTRQGPATSNFNQYSSIDMSLSQAVGQYLEILNKLESMVSVITGVTPQREGQTSASETATGVQQAQYQSSHITEPYFYYHNIVKRQVLTKLLETAKVAYPNGKKISYIVDEVYTAMLEVDGEIFPDSDYGVFVSNSSKDHQTKEKIESLASIALQQEKINLSDLITIYKSNSIAEIESKIRKGEAERAQAEQQNAQASGQQALQMNQEKMAWEREKMLNDNEQNELDRQNELQKATLAAMKGKDGPGDMNGNGIPDPVETARLYMDQSMNNAKVAEGQGKMALQAAKQMKDAEIAEKKLYLDAQKLEVDREKMHNERQMFEREQDQQDKQNKVDLQMKREEHQMKKTEIKEKTALEKYKVKHTPTPKPAAKKK